MSSQGLPVGRKAVGSLFGSQKGNGLNSHLRGKHYNKTKDGRERTLQGGGWRERGVKRGGRKNESAQITDVSAGGKEPLVLTRNKIAIPASLR